MKMSETEGKIIEFDGTEEMADEIGLWTIKNEDGNPLKFIQPLGGTEFQLIKKGDKFLKARNE